MSDLFGGTAPQTISVAMKVAEIELELKYRRYVYASRVSEKKMKQEVADRRIKIMEAILQDYQQGRVT